MKKFLQPASISWINLFLLSFLCSTNDFSQIVTLTYSYTGSAQTLTLPPLCGLTMTVEARGASGSAGGTSGGQGALGGIAKGVFSPTGNISLNIYVGGTGSIPTGGYNGGGHGGISSTSTGGGGGGGSDVRFNGTALANRIIVAAGGGGGGGNSTYVPNAAAGGGGSAFTPSLASGFGGAGAVGSCATANPGGDYGGTASNYGSGGGGGGFLSGGQGGGQPSSTTGGYGCNGALGAGGDGGGTTFICGGASGGVNGGGGGGGGFYGGGGGMTGTGGCNGGGGGGSSYVNNSMFSNISYTAGTNSGNGLIIITYTSNGPGVTAVTSNTSLCSPNAATLAAAGVNSYTWAPSVTNPNNSSVTVTPSTTITYTVSGTNSLNCISMALITITATPGVPNLSLSSTNNTVCIGKSTTLTASGALSYSWGTVNQFSVVVTPTVTTSFVATGSNACGTSTSAITITAAPIPMSIAANPTITCSGSPVSISVTAVATNYTWMPNSFLTTNSNVIFSPTITTVYTVAVTDGTCFGAGVLSLPVSPIPTVNLSSNPVSPVCAGTSVSLTASGGVSYTWTPGNFNTASIVVTPTASTLYSVAASNSVGCKAGNSYPMVINASPTIIIYSSGAIVCNGGTVSLNASGASSYLWNGGSTLSTLVPTLQTSTIFTVTGTTNSCSSSQTVQVLVFTPTVTISGQSVVCKGSSATFTATGGDIYLWDDNSTSDVRSVIPPSTTIYSLNAYTNTFGISCPSNATFQVVVIPNPTINIVATPSAICAKESSTLTANGANSYSWNTGSTSASIVITSSVQNIITYTVTGTTTQSCTSSKVITIKIDPCTGLRNSNFTIVTFDVYPNPSKGEFFIESSSACVVKIYNITGELIRAVNLNDVKENKVLVRELSSGIYIVESMNTYKKILVE